MFGRDGVGVYVWVFGCGCVGVGWLCVCVGGQKGEGNGKTEEVRSGEVVAYKEDKMYVTHTHTHTQTKHTHTYKHTKAHKVLKSHLHPFGYASPKFIPWMWKHRDKYIVFKLVVNDFGIK